MVSDNTAKFGTVTTGIHGGELPHFSGDNGSKEWWRLQSNMKEAPAIQSRLLLKQTQQYWAKNDGNLLSDMQHAMAPQDTFKQMHIPKQGTKEVPSKVNFAQHCSDASLQKPADVGFGYRHKDRWTQKTRDTRCEAGTRTFDKIIAGSIAREN